MRREQLHPHPTLSSAAIRELTVGIDWRGALVLHYLLRGNIGALRIPTPVAPLRTDELWRHTCCELFVTVAHASWYCEFNFSPSGAWAAYHFDGYRSGMKPLEVAAPAISVQATDTLLQLTVELALDSVPVLRTARELRCALAAVVEEQAGTRSFWALEHAAPQPDFHHPQGFALDLQAS